MSTFIKVPSFWESLLKRYVKKTFYAGTRREDFAGREGFTEGDYRFFAHGVRELNIAFTRERGSLPKNYFNRKELRSGYILYFLPVNALKVAALLGQSLPDLPQPPSFSILDIGSGPGTGMLGVMLWLENRLKSHEPPFERLEWILIDQNRDVLQDARDLHQEAISHLRETTGCSIKSELKILVGDLFQNPSRMLQATEADLILSSNFLSELPRQKRLPLVEILLRRHLKEGGRMLIMEPALQRTTRELMGFHDEIVERRRGVVFAPCLHQAACPMLCANRRDWCHTYIEWERPAWIERLDRLAAIRKDYLKCSYLVLGPRRGVLQYAPTYTPDTWRVVSGHLNSRGKSEILLCGPGALPNLQRVTRLDRDRSPGNEGFDRLARGDLLILPRQARIGKGTRI